MADRYKVRKKTVYEVVEPLEGEQEAVHYSGDEETATQVRNDMQKQHEDLESASEKIQSEAMRIHRAELLLEDSGKGNDSTS